MSIKMVTCPTCDGDGVLVGETDNGVQCTTCVGYGQLIAAETDGSKKITVYGKGDPAVGSARLDGTLDTIPTPDMTITVGPFSIVFGNRNDAMGLKLHFHTAYVWMEYAVDGDGHGYPSFEKTNNALRQQLRELCKEPFIDATNEVVLARLFGLMRHFTDPSWDQYGGSYHLSGMRLDVVGVPDSIGHDDGATTYTIRETTR